MDRSQIRRRTALGAALAASLLAPRRMARAADAGAPIIVGSKIDTEGALLGNLIAQALRGHNLPVITRLQLGPTSICRAALRAGALDIYPEYTGNGADFFHRQGDPAWHSPSAAWNLVRALDAPNQIVWLPPAPANNGWGIAMRQNGLAAARPGACRGQAFRPPATAPSLEDFAAYLRCGGRLLLAASVEFVESPDALPAFEASYGFHLRQDQLITLAGGNTAATLRATSASISGINAGMAYSTDGALEALHLVLLGDPHHAQIVFQPAPTMRAQTLQRYPHIPAILAPVFAALTLAVLRDLNAQIAAGGNDPADVAARFLARGV